MSGIESGAFYTLFNPCTVAATDTEPKFHTYLAVTKVERGNFAVSIAHPVDKHHDTPLLSQGTIAYVMGSLVVVDRAIFITASAIVDVFLAASPTLRAEYPKLFRPYLSFHGVVSANIIDVNKPGVKVFDVTVDCKDHWPKIPVVLRCFFDRDEKRFRSLLAFDVNTALELSGVLMGWIDGKLCIDVHQVDSDNEGDLPDDALASYPSPYESRDTSGGFAIFNDPSTLPQQPGLPQLSRCPPGVSAMV